MVASAAGEEICACDLVESSGRSQPTVSHHMKVLCDAGLVTKEKRGVWVWYRIVTERLEALRSVLR
jgi:ArsR family transcriptional regulator, arsenate/arsenite/antimonite-responsive transcriptional repressor